MPQTLTIRSSETPRSVDRRLTTLGLSETVLREAVLAGAYEHLERTPHSTATGPAVAAWNAVVETLRDTLKPSGRWRASNDSNRGLVVCDEHQILLEPLTGSPATGTLVTPRSAQKRGPVACRTLQLSEQIALPGKAFALVTAPERRQKFDDYELWSLLFYFDNGLREARLELSRPVGLDEGNRLAVWAERLLLEPVSMNPTDSVHPPDDPSPEIDATEQPVIDIRRKRR
ncbi:MAG: hypothetical protein SangKO_075970 [Sandaracinaceae bacterium]